MSQGNGGLARYHRASGDRGGAARYSAVSPEGIGRAIGEFCGSVLGLPAMAVPREFAVTRLSVEGGALAEAISAASAGHEGELSCEG